jgi:hypothetical protein
MQAGTITALTVQQHQPTDGWLARIPTVGQMLLGFILPFALAFIAIPLESLIHSARTVGGVFLIALVLGAALILRVAGLALRHACRILIRLYDIGIVLPLLAEQLVKRPRQRVRADADDTEIQRTHA